MTTDMKKAVERSLELFPAPDWHHESCEDANLYEISSSDGSVVIHVAGADSWLVMAGYKGYRVTSNLKTAEETLAAVRKICHFFEKENGIL